MQDEFQFPSTVEDVIRQVDNAVRAPSETELSASWHGLSERLEAIKQRGTGDFRLYRGASRRSASQVSRWVWSIGAVVGIAIVGGVVGLTKNAAPGTTRTYSTGAGQQATVTLGDGTRITLASQTTLRVLGSDTKTRQVALDHGEAYFNVVHAAGQAFRVQSGHMMTDVLGTEFLVHRTSNNQRVRVAVVSGRVRITANNNDATNLTLTAGRVGEFVDSTAQVNGVDDVSSIVEDRRGRLVFYHTSVEKVLANLTRWYGYQFRCADSALPRRNVTIVVSLQSSAAALAALEQVLDVNVTMMGDTVTLNPQPTPLKGAPPARTYNVWIPTREVGR